ncbi:MAG: lipoate--protein ligase [Syntrophomonadaceae bacterium]|nr:lipoate--protein ligase [Syntrophomonadaceae bacterium]MDD3890419.1 lipoate--protein ligase [Syntrophomonadaceae bacterium]MDD4550344.1 lipoate--protein ligase [Syntrophomonadaceae bacterium]
MLEIINRSTDPYFNLALEEYVIKNMNTKEEFFILWQNQPVVVVGKNQNTIEEINQEYINNHDVKVVRRLSGGGAVYHDLDNLNFTFIVNDNKNYSFDFSAFTRPVIKALAAIGIKAENNGRNDITIDGKKFSGNSQFRYHDRLLHHGTILFNSNLENVGKALNVKEEKIVSKGVKSVRSRVTNITDYLTTPITINEFKTILNEAIKDEYKDLVQYELSPEEQAAVQDLRDNKYSTWEWVYGGSPQFNVKHAAKFDWGYLDIRLNVKHGLITNCKIYGDFFANQDIADMERKFEQVKYHSEALSNMIRQLNIKQYLPSANEEEIINLLLK